MLEPNEYILSFLPGESTTVPGLNFSLAVVGAIGVLEVLGRGVGDSVVVVFLVLNTMGGNGVGRLLLK